MLVIRNQHCAVSSNGRTHDRASVLCYCVGRFAEGASADAGTLLTGKAAFGDWHADAPLVRRKISAGELPPPYASKSADNPPRLVAKPAAAMPMAPPGFQVELFASNLRDPR